MDFQQSHEEQMGLLKQVGTRSRSPGSARAVRPTDAPRAPPTPPPTRARAARPAPTPTRRRAPSPAPLPLLQAADLLQGYVSETNTDASLPVVRLAAPDELRAAFGAAGVPLPLADGQEPVGAGALAGAAPLAAGGGGAGRLAAARDSARPGRGAIGRDPR
jgi:hypothetical protein